MLASLESILRKSKKIDSSSLDGTIEKGGFFRKISKYVGIISAGAAKYWKPAVRVTAATTLVFLVEAELKRAYAATYNVNSEHSVKSTSDDVGTELGGILSGGVYGKNVAIDNYGNYVVVHSTGIRKYDIDGNLIRDITYSFGDGTRPKVVIDKNTSDFVTTWEMDRNVYAQRFDKDGNSIGHRFLVMDNVLQARSPIAIDREGNFIITVLYNYRTYAQRFDKDGNRIGDIYQIGGSDSSIGMDDNGGSVLIWTNRETDPYKIVGQIFDKTGNRIGHEFTVSTAKGDGADYEICCPSIAINNDEFIVIWEDYDNNMPSSYGVFAQRFDKDANETGEEFRVNRHIEDYQMLSDITIDREGNFVAAWMRWDGFDADVFAQRFDRDGKRVGDEFRVNSYAEGWQGSAAIAINNSKYFVIGWAGVGEGGDQGIYARIFPFYNPADLNKDGYVDFKDFAIFTNNWLAYHP